MPRGSQLPTPSPAAGLRPNSPGRVPRLSGNAPECWRCRSRSLRGHRPGWAAGRRPAGSLPLRSHHFGLLFTGIENLFPVQLRRVVAAAPNPGIDLSPERVQLQPGLCLVRGHRASGGEPCCLTTVLDASVALTSPVKNGSHGDEGHVTVHRIRSGPALSASQSQLVSGYQLRIEAQRPPAAGARS